MAEYKEKFIIAEKETNRADRERDELKGLVQRREEEIVKLRQELEEKLEFLSKSRKECEEAVIVMRTTIHSSSK